MPKIKLGREFFTRPAVIVSKEILGKHIVRFWRGKKIIGKIVEVEAYIGPEDKASHAYGGKITKRNKAEYYEGGHVYIYLVYGMYWQFNITTGPADHPQCLLVRAAEPVKGFKDREASGPGKFCNALKLNKSFYGEDVTRSKRLWLEDSGFKIKKTDVVSCPRIGIDYAKEWAKKPLRFYIKGNNFVSKF